MVRQFLIYREEKIKEKLFFDRERNNRAVRVGNRSTKDPRAGRSGPGWNPCLNSAAAAAKSLQSCPTEAHEAPPSLGFSRQEHWSGLPFPSPMHESEK